MNLAFFMTRIFYMLSVTIVTSLLFSDISHILSLNYVINLGDLLFRQNKLILRL